MQSREGSIWAYAWDLQDEGVDHALHTIQYRGGLSGVNVAAAYHAGKFLHVHNPRRRVVFPQAGALYFTPDSAWYGKLRIQPPVWDEGGTKLWAELRRRTAERGMTLTAWTLCLHNSMVGFTYPDCAVINVYGDSIPTDLCPRQPDIRAYLVALTRDIATNLDVDRIVLESLEYMPFQHGYHHEVIGVPLTPVVEFLMSLCFCPKCAEAAKSEGVDFDGVRTWVRETLDAHFADPFSSPVQMSWPELKAALDGDFQAFLDLRREALTTLLQEIAQTVRDASACRLAILDFGPLFGLGPDGRRWQNGVDLAEHLPLVDEIHPTFYATDPAMHRAKVEQYAGILMNERPMHAAIRAIIPQVGSPEQLRARLEPLASHAAGFSFYNYGFMALPVLDWIREGMTAITRGDTA